MLPLYCCRHYAAGAMPLCLLRLLLIKRVHTLMPLLLPPRCLRYVYAMRALMALFADARRRYCRATPYSFRHDARRADIALFRRC